MGEIADAMLDGTFCAQCGEYLDREPLGFPDYCSERCARDAGMTIEDERTPGIPVLPRADKALRTCPICSKVCKTVAGVAQHWRDKHTGG